MLESISLLEVSNMARFVEESLDTRMEVQIVLGDSLNLKINSLLLMSLM